MISVLPSQGSIHKHKYTTLNIHTRILIMIGIDADDDIYDRIVFLDH